MSYFNSITQNVTVDANNSSTAVLNAGNSYTFTGTYTSTLGVNGLQVSMKTDQVCNIYIEQSTDHVNWDQVDTYTYNPTIDNFGVTVQAINSFYRVRVIAVTTTTYFRLQSCLCPIVEAVPRSLDANGNFKIANPKDQYDFGIENTPSGEMRVVTPVRLVGTTFEGTTIDPNFWTTAASGTGTIAQSNNQLVLTSGNNTATVTSYSSRRARYNGGSANRYRAVIQQDLGTANNIRNWGVTWGASMPTKTDGAWFQLSGTTLSVVTMIGTSATTVTSGAFNGSLGSTYTPPATVITYEIYYTNSKVIFVVNNQVLHTVLASSTNWSATKNLHAFSESINSGAATSTVMNVRVASIYRLGKFESNPQYFHGTTAATTVLKYSAGMLHRIVLNNAGGTLITIYDGLSAAGAVIAVINTPATADSVTLEYGVAFSNGLTVVTTGTWDFTLIYE